MHLARWSIAQTKNRETTAEGIGWELFRNYVIARDKYQPNYFLYENNKSMSPAIRAQITAELGVEPVLINSALVSAQNRQRLYWVGRRNPDGTYSQVAVEQPVDRGILLQDILESGVCLAEKSHTLKAQYYKNGMANFVTNGGFSATGVAEPICVNSKSGRGGVPGLQPSLSDRIYSVDGKSTAVTTAFHPNVAVPVDACCVAQRGRYIGEGGKVVQHFEARTGGKTNTLTTVEKDNLGAEPIRIGTIENDAKNQTFDSQQYRVYSPDGKAVPLCGNGGGLGAKTGLYATPVDTDADGILHLGSLYGQHSRWGVFAKDGKCPTITASMGMGGGHVPMVPTRTDEEGHCQKNPTTAKQIYEVRDGKISIGNTWYPIKLRDGFYIIRKLTVRECMRLQTVPEEYVFPVSDSQAYKMLGNGWTVDVIAHIMSHFTGLTEEPVEVLSMYDGMSCGHIALDKLGVNVTTYYATEIDKYAIQTTQHNFPETIQLGDAFQVREENWHL